MKHDVIWRIFDRHDYGGMTRYIKKKENKEKIIKHQASKSIVTITFVFVPHHRSSTRFETSIAIKPRYQLDFRITVVLQRTKTTDTVREGTACCCHGPWAMQPGHAYVYFLDYAMWFCLSYLFLSPETARLQSLSLSLSLFLYLSGLCVYICHVYNIYLYMYNVCFFYTYSSSFYFSSFAPFFLLQTHQRNSLTLYISLHVWTFLSIEFGFETERELWLLTLFWLIRFSWLLRLIVHFFFFFFSPYTWAQEDSEDIRQGLIHWSCRSN